MEEQKNLPPVKELLDLDVPNTPIEKLLAMLELAEAMLEVNDFDSERTLQVFLKKADIFLKLGRNIEAWEANAQARKLNPELKEATDQEARIRKQIEATTPAKPQEKEKNKDEPPAHLPASTAKMPEAAPESKYSLSEIEKILEAAKESWDPNAPMMALSLYREVLKADSINDQAWRGVGAVYAELLKDPKKNQAYIVQFHTLIQPYSSVVAKTCFQPAAPVQAGSEPPPKPSFEVMFSCAAFLYEHAFSKEFKANKSSLLKQAQQLCDSIILETSVQAAVVHDLLADIDKEQHKELSFGERVKDWMSASTTTGAQKKAEAIIRIASIDINNQKLPKCQKGALESRLYSLRGGNPKYLPIEFLNPNVTRLIATGIISVEEMELTIEMPHIDKELVLLEWENLSARGELKGRWAKRALGDFWRNNARGSFGVKSAYTFKRAEDYYGQAANEGDQAALRQLAAAQYGLVRFGHRGESDPFERYLATVQRWPEEEQLTHHLSRLEGLKRLQTTNLDAAEAAAHWQGVHAILVKRHQQYTNEQLPILFLSCTPLPMALAILIVSFYEVQISCPDDFTEKGYAKAQYSVALCYEYGMGVAEDKNELVKWLELAIANGYSEAGNRLFQYYFRLAHDLTLPEAGPINYDYAVLAVKLLEYGTPEEQYHLGMLRRSDGCNDQRTCFASAVKRGHVQACYQLGLHDLRKSRNMTDELFKRGCDYIKQAADKGDEAAKCILEGKLPPDAPRDGFCASEEEVVVHRIRLSLGLEGLPRFSQLPDGAGTSQPVPAAEPASLDEEPIADSFDSDSAPQASGAAAVSPPIPAEASPSQFGPGSPAFLPARRPSLPKAETKEEEHTANVVPGSPG